MARMELVHNTDRKFGSQKEYLRIRLDDGRYLLFTESQVKQALQRAEANPEDCLELDDALSKDFWRSLFNL